jgi:uncharacterized protein with HEPN domain
MTIFDFVIYSTLPVKRLVSQRVHKRADLDTDRKLNLSLVRLLEIIGEAARGTSVEFRQEHTDLPWKSMIGMRDRLIHGYFDINLEVV